MTVLVIADRTIDRISCGECCTLSGVNSGVRYIDVSNKRFERERFIRQGPLSRFLEQADGQACRHVWTFSSGSWRSLFGLGGVRAQGLGGSFGWADSRFHGDYPIEEVLELEKEKDSGFVKRLRHAIRNPEEDSSEHFFDWLFETLEAYEEAHPDWGEARKAREWRREEPKAWCEAVGKAGGTNFFWGFRSWIWAVLVMVEGLTGHLLGGCDSAPNGRRRVAGLGYRDPAKAG